MKSIHLLALSFIMSLYACNKKQSSDPIDTIVGTYKGWEYSQGIRNTFPFADSIYTEVKIEKANKDEFKMTYWGFNYDRDSFAYFTFTTTGSLYTFRKFRDIKFSFFSDKNQKYINLSSDVTVTSTDYDGNTYIEYQNNTSYKGLKD